MDYELPEGDNITTKLSRGHGYCEDCNSLSYNTSGTADAGSDATHTVDAERTEAEDFWNGCYIKYVSGDNVGLHRLVTDFHAGTDTLDHDSFPNAVSAGDDYVLTDWKLTTSGDTATLEVLNGDVFDINHILGTGSVYWEYDITPNLTQSLYKKILIRYKTGNEYIKAKVELVFTSGNQTVLTETSSLTWAFVKVDITEDDPVKVVDKIRIYATTTVGHVYYDVFLIYQDDFEFPHVSRKVEVEANPRIPKLGIPGRVTDVTQNLGEEGELIRVSGDMELGEWGTPKGDALFDIQHNASSEPFQWFSNDYPKRNYKVQLIKPIWTYEGDMNGKPRFNLTFREYSLSDKSNETYAERFGI